MTDLPAIRSDIGTAIAAGDCQLTFDIASPDVGSCGHADRGPRLCWITVAVS
jgi:hypothetical protein